MGGSSPGSPSSDNYLKRIEEWLLRNRIIALVIFLGIVVTLVADFLGSVEKIHEALRAILAKPPPNRSAWVSKNPVPAPVDFAAVVGYGGAIFVAGGDNQSAAKRLWRYDIAHDTWETSGANPMPGGRWSTDGAVVKGGKLYIAGGWDYYVPPSKLTLPADNLWSYEISSNTWDDHAGPPLPHHRGGSGSGCGALGLIDDKLYVVSPEVGVNGYYKFLDTLDLSSGHPHKWKTLAPPAAAHACGAFGVIDDKLYVAGGYTVDSEGSKGYITAVTEVYDPSGGKWKTLADMPTPVLYPGSAVGCNKLFVVGGSASSADGKRRIVSSVQVYEPPNGENLKGRWTQKAALSLDSPRFGLGAVVVDGNLYAIGGRREDDTPESVVQAILGICGNASSTEVTRNAPGEFLAQLDDLRNSECGPGPTPTCLAKWQELRGKIEDYLGTNLGPSYRTRFKVFESSRMIPAAGISQEMIVLNDILKELHQTVFSLSSSVWIQGQGGHGSGISPVSIPK